MIYLSTFADQMQASQFCKHKITTIYAFINAIFAEYMGAKYGLGVYLNCASSSFDTSGVFAIIIVIIVVTLSMLKIVDILEKKVIKWSVDETTNN